MRVIEKATRAEIRAMGADLDASALARAAIELAQRLDVCPSDRDATALSRELRQVLAALHERHDQAAGGELDAFLAGVSAASLRKPTD